MTVGVISDTHNWLRPEVSESFADCDCILHAGDICSEEILNKLKEITNVYAVRGNMDHGSWAYDLPEKRMIELGGAGIYMLHDLAKLDLEPQAAGIKAVIHGHTHRVKVVERHGVLYINPGSAGASRGGFLTAVRMKIEDGNIQVQILEFK